MTHARWRRRALALWVGILVTWAAAGAAAYIRFRESLVPVLIVMSTVSLLVGTVGTLRMRSQASEPLITVEDLRRR